MNVNAEVKESGETHKVNLSWKIEPQVMVYATYSTGFRPGGINRPVHGASSRPTSPTRSTTTSSAGRPPGWTGACGSTARSSTRSGTACSTPSRRRAPRASRSSTTPATPAPTASRATSPGVPTEHLTLTASGTVLHAALTQSFCNYETNPTPPPADHSHRLRAQGHPAAGAAELQAQRQRPLRVHGPRLQELPRRRPAGPGPVHLGAVHRRRGVARPDAAFATLDLSAGFGKDNWTFSVFAAERLRRARRAQQQPPTAPSASAAPSRCTT